MIIINPYPFFRAEPVVLNKRVSLPDLRDFITTEDAARVLNFHVENVHRLLREGDLKGVKIGTTDLESRI